MSLLTSKVHYLRRHFHSYFFLLEAKRNEAYKFYNSYFLIQKLRLQSVSKLRYNEFQNLRNH